MNDAEYIAAKAEMDGVCDRAKAIDRFARAEAHRLHLAAQKTTGDEKQDLRTLRRASIVAGEMALALANEAYGQFLRSL
jgi:hypothetical protein